MLERKTLPGRGPDYPILVAILAVITCIIVAYPVNFHPVREHFFTSVYGRTTFSQKENIAATATFVTLTCGVSIVYPNIAHVITIMGGLLATSMNYLVPVICLVRLGKDKWTSPYNLSAIIFFGALILCGYTSVGITIYEMANRIEMMPHHHEK